MLPDGLAVSYEEAMAIFYELDTAQKGHTDAPASRGTATPGIALADMQADDVAV
jgi:hypothetical protein